MNFRVNLSCVCTGMENFRSRLRTSHGTSLPVSASHGVMLEGSPIQTYIMVRVSIVNEFVVLGALVFFFFFDALIRLIFFFSPLISY